MRQAFCRFGDFAAAGEASSLKTRARAEELSNSEARAGPEMQRSRRREKTYVKVVSVGARKQQKELAPEDCIRGLAKSSFSGPAWVAKLSKDVLPLVIASGMSRGFLESPNLIRAFANRRRELVQTMSQLRSSRMLRSRDLETSILSLWRFRHRRRSFFIENASEGRRTIKLNGASWFGGASLSQAGENVCQSGLCRRAEATKRASSGRLRWRTC